MGFLDRLLGRAERRPSGGPAYSGYEAGADPYGSDAYPGGSDRPRTAVPGHGAGAAAPGSDEAAVERYRYLLATAPPGMIEQAHAEAFATLSPEQRRQVLERLSAEVPAAERATTDDPRQLARMATRAEMRSPGTLERSFAGMGGGMGPGSMIAGSLLAGVAGAFIGTAVAGAMFDMSSGGGDAAAGDQGEAAGGSEDAGDVGGDGGGDVGGGDFGGDFGGGDFGGGFGGDF